MASIEHPIRKVTGYVLSEWAMMLVEPAELSAEIFSPEQPFFRVSAYYRGVFDGDLTIICQEAFLDVLARNVLGIDDQDELLEDERWDALRELGNIISGNFLVEAYGSDTVFDLPRFELQQTCFSEVKREIDTKLAEFMGNAIAIYSADGHPIFVSFNIEANDYSGLEHDC